VLLFSLLATERHGNINANNTPVVSDNRMIHEMPVEVAIFML